MCGLFGFNGIIAPSPEKLKILGIYNQTRGKDSCGYWYNGVLNKSSSLQEKEWSDFIQKNIIQIEENAKCHTFIGHVRQGSTGFAKTIDNAHPFVIDDSFIIAHNGTISNYEELCEKYGIDDKFSVDSKALGTLLHRVNYKEILESYKGYAALLLCDLNNPNRMYVYHGSSKTYKLGTEVEERPLYFMQTFEGIYFSSMKEALLAIRDDETQEPKNLKYNSVIPVENGDFIFDDIIEIDRGECNVTTYNYPSTYNNGSYHSSPASNANKATQSQLNLLDETLNKLEFSKIWLEKPTLFHNDLKWYTFFWRGRYYDSATNELMDGYYKVERGEIYEKASEDKDNDTNYEYYYRGVLIDPDKVLEFKLNHTATKDLFRLQGLLFSWTISKYSIFPVCCLEDESTNYYKKEDRLKFYHNSKIVSEFTFTPRYSIRHYKVGRHGFFENISCNNMTDIQSGMFFRKEIYEKLKSTEGDYSKTESGVLVPKTVAVLPPAVIKTEESAPLSYVDQFKKFKLDEATTERLSALYEYTTKKYKNAIEIWDDVPVTVLRAIEFYFIDLLSHSASKITATIIDNHVHNILKYLCQYNMSINESIKNIEKYIVQAYYEEVNDDEDEKEDVEEQSVQDIEHEEVIETNEESAEREFEKHQLSEHVEGVITEEIENMTTLASMITQDAQEDDALANEISYTLFRTVDFFKIEMINIAKKHNLQNITKLLTNIKTD